MQKVAIKFKDYEGLFYVVDNQGKKWVALRPLLTALGADVEAELAMIRNDNPLKFYVNDIDLAHYTERRDSTTAEAEPCFYLEAISALFIKLPRTHHVVKFEYGFFPQNVIREDIRLQLSLAKIEDAVALADAKGKPLDEYLSELLADKIFDEKVQNTALKRIKK